MLQKALLYAMSSSLLAAGGNAWSQQPQPGADFPDAPAKAFVVPMCGACHNINRLKAGYTPEGWHTVMRMMQNMEVPLPAEQAAAVTEYLIKSFPEPTRPAAVIIDGPAKAEIRMFQVLTPGSRPHDPLASRDGAIWYTGQMTNKLGGSTRKPAQPRNTP